MIVHKITIRCDECDLYLDTSVADIDDALKYACHRNWTFNGGKNRCPRCSKKRGF